MVTSTKIKSVVNAWLKKNKVSVDDLVYATKAQWAKGKHKHGREAVLTISTTGALWSLLGNLFEQYDDNAVGKRALELESDFSKALREIGVYYIIGNDGDIHFLEVKPIPQREEFTVIDRKYNFRYTPDAYEPPAPREQTKVRVPKS